MSSKALLAGAAALFVGSTSGAFEARAAEVRLVLQITVDGLRGDLLNRYSDGFGEGGFNWLLQHGAVYTDAHYQHANTETIVGHTTLATGASPSAHGMIGNAWFDREKGRLAYNIEDAEHLPLPTRKNQTEAAQVDPSQAAARSKGRSPKAILVPTLSDTLSAFHAGKSKIFGVSGKDRAAVSMAGHTGKAFWFSTDSGDMMTTSYYYEAYPAWVVAWNEARKAEKYAGDKWELSGPPDSYLLFEQDDRPYEVDLRGYGRTFPHPFGAANDPLFTTRLLVSPIGDELVADFAKTLLRNEGLGADAVPDYLALSFSGVDAVNHFFGPSSLENEETVRRLDRTLADLFKFVDGSVGLDKTLIVLCADHGMADMPEYLEELGYATGRLTPDQITEVANAAGEKLGVEEITRFFYRPYLYLDREKIAAAKLDFGEVEKAVAAAITAVDGISLAAPTHHLDSVATHPATPFIRSNKHHLRSGDIYVAQSPYWFLFDSGPVACMHGSPWRYDTHVPLIFAGSGIEPARVSRRVHPADVAPTLAAILGMSAPAGASGVPLAEVVE